LTKNRLELRRQLIIASGILTVLAFFGLATNISTTLSELDWLVVSTIYLTISFALATSTDLNAMKSMPYKQF
jgi:hypothetical protein